MPTDRPRACLQPRRLRIRLLADSPGLLDPVASWLQAAWFARAGHPATAAAEALAQRLHRDRAPLALVATSGHHPVGTASLVLAEHPFEPGEAHFLSSVFVVPAWRHRGIGHQLCNAVAARASSIGVQRLFLLSADRCGFYEGMGWEACGERVASAGSQMAFVSLMTLACRGVDRSPGAGQRASRGPRPRP